MKVAITGGTGLIGRELSTMLFRAGYQVIVLSRNPDKHHLPEGIRIENWDISNIGQSLPILEGIDVIVNLAGENISSGLWTEKRKNSIRQSRIRAGKALVETIARMKQKPQVFIQSSGIGYYGTSLTETFTEDSPPGKDYLASVSMDWEESTRVVEEMGTRRIIIRTGLVLSAQGGVLPKLVLPVKLFAGGSLGNGRQWYSWIHIQDHIQSVRFLIENQTARGIYNLSSPEPVCMAEFSKTVARVIKRPYWLPVPAIALKLILGEMSTLILDGQKVFPGKLISQGYAFQYPVLEPALIDLLLKQQDGRLP